MSNLVPEGWSYRCISDFAKTSAGGTPSTQVREYWDNGHIPWMSSGEVHKKRVFKVDNYITQLGFDNSSAKLFPSKTILMALAGQGKTRGTVAISEIELTTNQSIAAIIIKDSNIFPDFVFYNLGNRYEELRGVSGGSGRAGLNLSIIGEQELLLPPLPEQQKIAAILTSVDEVIEKTQAQIDKLKDLKTAMMQELLTNGVGTKQASADAALNNRKGYIPHTEFKDSPVGRIPKSWEVMTLGDITLESAFGPRFSSNEYAADGNIGCIRTTDIDENWDINYSTVPLARLNFKDFEKHILVGGDLLVTRSGTCGLVDVYREQSIPMVAAAFLIRFRLNETVSPFFVRYLMMSTYIQENIQLLASGGVQKNLSGTSLKTLKMPRPSIREQNEIVNIIESVNERIAISNKKLASNIKLKKALMQDLLTGKVRVKVD